MPQTIQVGTILIEDRPLFARYLAIKSEPYASNWRMVEGSDGLALDRKIHAAGWNFFFLQAKCGVPSSERPTPGIFGTR